MGDVGSRIERGLTWDFADGRLLGEYSWKRTFANDLWSAASRPGEDIVHQGAIWLYYSLEDRRLARARIRRS